MLNRYIMEPYDSALFKILKSGVKKTNRTGIDTLSIFGLQTRYEIHQFFPILTKRKIYYKSIFAELLWMLSGSTNVHDLEKLGSKIWTPWISKEFEEKNGYPDGDLGPAYGFLMRSFGGTYPDKSTGFDQISYIVNEIRSNPESRRIILNLWNAPVVTSSKVRLPPCHFCFQLNVNYGRLDGMLTQRSGDYPVGCCANVQFYSALIYMLSQQCNLTPGELVHSVGDAHIYVNQIPQVEEYLSRANKNSPILNLQKADDIFSYKVENFIIEDYDPHPPIKMEVAI
jgi:thymidylate synthase